MGKVGGEEEQTQSWLSGIICISYLGHVLRRVKHNHKFFTNASQPIRC